MGAGSVARAGTPSPAGSALELAAERRASVSVLESFSTLKWRLQVMKSWNGQSKQNGVNAAALSITLGSLGLVPWRVVAQTDHKVAPPTSRSQSTWRESNRRLNRLGTA